MTSLDRNAIEAALSALDEGSQDKRLLRIAFPRGDGPDALLLVHTLRAKEELSKCFRFEAELLSDNAYIPLKPMLGKMATISLVREDGSLRHFNGYVTTFEMIRADGGFAFYRMVLEPWLAFAKLRKNNVSFLSKSVVEMTEATFGYYQQRDWKPMLLGDDPRITCANQFDETDYNHLHRRWEARGYFYWYEHRFDGHTLILCDKSTLPEPIDAMEGDDPDWGEPDEIPFRSQSGAGEDDAVHSWRALRSAVSSTTTLSSFDFKYPSTLRASDDSFRDHGELLNHEVYEYAGAYGFATHDEGVAMAQRRTEARDCAAQYFEASGNDRAVLPGRSFRLSGHFSSDTAAQATLGMGIAGRRYLIVRAEHEASNNYQTDAGAPSHYRNRFRCIRSDLPWRPALHHNSEPSVCHGLQTARVVGPSGSVVHTDGYGRVKVQFHWDRVGTYDEASSPWVRVMAPAAGAEFGQVRLPRVGEEVVIQFLDGNPDRPLIIGSVYNNRHMPPWKLPEQAALSGLRSREFDGKRGNHLILDDTPNKIQAQLRSDHLASQLSLGHIGRIEDTSGRKEARGEGWELRTDGHGVARAAKGLLITTEARNNARGSVKDMGETIRRLENAERRHKELAELAAGHEAQQAGADQSEIATELGELNKAVQGGRAGEGNFPELSAAHLVLASQSGIVATTAGTIHVASERHSAISAGSSMSIASGAGLFASIGKAFRLFVHKAGMKLVAAGGDIDIQALSDNIKLLAKLEISQTANRITISAKEEVVINGGGSYARFSSGGIEQGTNGTFVAHAARHSLPGPKNLEMSFNMPPVTELKPNALGTFHVGSHAVAAGRIGAGLPFELYKDGALLEEGKIDDDGNVEFKHEIDTEAKYQLKLPGGQIFGIGAGDTNERHEFSAGMGFHGYENSSGALSEFRPAIEQDRVTADPSVEPGQA